MSGKSLSHLSEEATQEQNVAGVTTPILVVSPDDTLFRLLNAVGSGDEYGIPMFADLTDTNGNPMPVDTSLVFRVKRPTDDEPITVSVKEDNISPWNNLSTAEQRHEDNIDAVKIELQGQAVNVRDKDEFRVEVNSTEQIDWSASEMYFPREAVREHSYEG